MKMFSPVKRDEALINRIDKDMFISLLNMCLEDFLELSNEEMLTKFSELFYKIVCTPYSGIQFLMELHDLCVMCSIPQLTLEQHEQVDYALHFVIMYFQ